jgi:hypothetical protein
LTLAAGGSALAAAAAHGQANAPALTESDPQAVALGYKADATKVDAAKYPTHQAGQVCSACNFFQGKAGAATGPCQLFAGKLVSSKGWCSGFAKKAA